MTLSNSSSSDSNRGVRSGAQRAELRMRGYRPRNGGGGSSRYRGLIVILVVAMLVVVGGLFLGVPALRSFAAGMAEGNTSAINYPFVGGLVRDELGASLTTPAGSDTTVVPITVSSGETVKQIGVDLTNNNLIARPLVFQYLVQSEGIGAKIQTGLFNLNQTMTPQAIVDRMQKTPDPTNPLVAVSLRGGLRLEQIAAYLQTLDLAMNVNDWYQEALNPPDQLRTDYPWLAALPAGRSLEGFLGLGVVYQVPLNATPDQFMHMLLDQWAKQAGPAVVSQATSKKNFYNILTLASIVERETGVDAEKAKIAGVYANRLNGNLSGIKLLDSDPTVIYANDTMKLKDMKFSDWVNYAFWTLSGITSMKDLQVSSDLQGYQTYVNTGLPPGPIDSPGLASIQAATNPDTSGDYLFFYACPGSKTHKFALTLQQQQKNILKCGSGN
jgi:UPF0755 protein